MHPSPQPISGGGATSWAKLGPVLASYSQQPVCFPLACRDHLLRTDFQALHLPADAEPASRGEPTVSAPVLFLWLLDLGGGEGGPSVRNTQCSVLHPSPSVGLKRGSCPPSAVSKHVDQGGGRGAYVLPLLVYFTLF